jgi:hypothetical protein
VRATCHHVCHDEFDDTLVGDAMKLDVKGGGHHHYSRDSFDVIRFASSMHKDVSVSDFLCQEYHELGGNNTAQHKAVNEDTKKKEKQEQRSIDGFVDEDGFVFHDAAAADDDEDAQLVLDNEASCLKTNSNVVLFGEGTEYLEKNGEHKRIVVSTRQPLLQVGLPKAGTSSLHYLFEQSGYTALHHYCTDQGYCGPCFKYAINNCLHPMNFCGKGVTEAWFNLEFAVGSVESAGWRCVFPQILYLEEIHAESPQATFLLNFRNIDKWISSINRWADARQQLAKCILEEYPAKESLLSEDEKLKILHCNIVKGVRKFVKEHPSHALVEVNIDDPNAGEFLASVFDVDAEHWGNKNENLHNPELL